MLDTIISGIICFIIGEIIIINYIRKQNKIHYFLDDENKSIFVFLNLFNLFASIVFSLSVYKFNLLNALIVLSCITIFILIKILIYILWVGNK